MGAVVIAGGARALPSCPRHCPIPHLTLHVAQFLGKAQDQPACSSPEAVGVKSFAQRSDNDMITLLAMGFEPMTFQAWSQIPDLLQYTALSKQNPDWNPESSVHSSLIQKAAVI